MICPKCGHSNDDANRYCAKCGRKLQEKQRNSGLIAIIAVLCVVIVVLVLQLAEKDSAPSSEMVPALKETQKLETALPAETPGVPAPTEADGKHLDYVDGDWESVNLHDGNSILTIYAMAFTQELTRCKKMTINMDVTMNANTKCTDWQVWGRVGGKFVKLERISLPNGHGATTQSVRFNPPVTLDAIAVTPTIPGGYSWSMSLYVSDVVLE